MAKRSGQPALYEMMRSRNAAAAERSSARMEPPAEPEIEVMRDDASPSPILEKIMALASPGSTLRMPVGYLLLAAAGIIIVVTLAFVIGSKRGESAARARFEEAFGVLPPQAREVNDPLDEGPATLGVQPPVTLEENGRRASDAGDSSGPARPSNSWGPVSPARDPRQKDWNYFIAAENTTSRCVALAEFCRANGLETYVVPHKNGSRVIVFPGYKGPRDAPEVKALEARIHQVGDRYKAANKHETNMRDAYPAKFAG